MIIWNRQQAKSLDKNMKNILFFITFVILWPIEIYCQNINNISDEYGVIYIPVNDSTIVYCTKKGKKHEVKLNQISFVDGTNALVEFLKKNYYKPNPADDDYAYRVFFFILFDSRLKVKEVRCYFPPLHQCTESQKKRIKQYTKGIQVIKDRWKRKSYQKWYVYSFSFVTD